MGNVMTIKFWNVKILLSRNFVVMAQAPRHKIIIYEKFFRNKFHLASTGVQRKELAKQAVEKCDRRIRKVTKN